MKINEHWLDENKNPAGGINQDTGFTISWQNGPLGRDENRKEPNGAFVENVLVAVTQRLQFYQDSKFNCEENADAIVMINNAIDRLQSRTINREARKVEGTHER